MLKNIRKKKCLAGLMAAVLSLGIMGCSDTAEVTGGDTVSSSQESMTVLSMFEALEGYEDMPITLTEKSKTMLKENESLFTSNSTDGLEQYTDFDLDYRIIMKNVSSYGDRLMYIPEAYVISVSEEEVEGKTLTEMQLIDANEKYYYVIGMTSYGEIYEDDVVECYGLPVSDTTFENIGGGTTISLVLAGSAVNKIG